MATVDVIIPVYNQAKTLGACLAALADQSYPDFLITVVDDGSRDAPDTVLQKFIPLKITLIRQANQGAAAARNRGAEATRAPYIIFCDADSVTHHNLIKNLTGALEKNPQKSYAYCGFKFGIKTFHSFPFNAQRLRQMPYIHTTAVIRRQHFPGFDESLKRFQDWDLWLTMLEHGHTGVWVDQVLFTIQPGGTMSRWLPALAYRWLPWLPPARRYLAAKALIQRKHGIG